MPTPQYPTIKEAAYQLMPHAYQEASGHRRYVAQARQIMYAARPKLLAMIYPDLAAKGLRAQYFTQTLVPDYMSEHPDETADWDVVFDERGHFREPHRQNGRERVIGLGTLGVRQYIATWQGTVRDTIAHIMLPFDVHTSGPTHRYGAVLFIEKEGFNELIQQAQIAERFNIAPMSTKGMSNTAARRLVDELSGMGVPIYVLHVFDKSGFAILHTLRTDTRRYRFKNPPQVIDLGLTLADVQTMDLQSEPVNYRQRVDPKIDLERCGASAEEQAFLITGDRQRNPQTRTYYWPGQRVELNAMTSDLFVAWITRRLTEKGVTKVIPTLDILVSAYRLAVRTKTLNDAFARMQEDMAPSPSTFLRTSWQAYRRRSWLILPCPGMRRCGAWSPMSGGPATMSAAGSTHLHLHHPSTLLPYSRRGCRGPIAPGARIPPAPNAPHHSAASACDLALIAAQGWPRSSD